MKLEEIEKYVSIFQSLITALSIIVAGLWAYRRFVIQQERYPNLIFTADINIIGKQNNETLIELIATIENKGKAQHKMENFKFDLKAIFNNEQFSLSKKWGNQVDFSHEIAKGSFLPPETSFFFIDPGTTAKYSYVTKFPPEVTFAILHCTFDYDDSRNYNHTAEKTVKIPSLESQV